MKNHNKKNKKVIAKNASVFPKRLPDKGQPGLVGVGGSRPLPLPNVTEPEAGQPHVPILLQRELKRFE